MTFDIRNSPFNDDSFLLHDEEDMPEATPHTAAVRHLYAVLSQLFAAENWFIAANLQMRDRSVSANAASPDIAVFVGVSDPAEDISEWVISHDAGTRTPPPTVIFEFASSSTWHDDVDTDKKPLYYSLIGVQEYYAYDPTARRLWPRSSPRLRGWRVEDGRFVEQILDDDGRLWSQALNSYLRANNRHVELLDAAGVVRLTTAQAAKLAEQRAIAMAAIEVTERIHAEDRARHEADARRRAEAERQAEADARRRAESEIAELRARLQEMGGDGR